MAELPNALALLRMFAQEARVLILATAHTDAGDSANYTNIGVVNELLPSSGGGGDGKAATERR